MFSLPETIKPRAVLSGMRDVAPVMEFYRPLFTAMKNVFVFEGIHDLQHGEITRSRVSTLTQDELLRVYLLRLLRRVAKMDHHELWFASINLTSHEVAKRRDTEVVNSMFKRMEPSPWWVGVKVPGRVHGPHAHLHVICAVPITVRAITQLATFETRRNRFKRRSAPRSAFIESIWDVQGLYGYFCGRKNLRVPGAKVIASKRVKSRTALC